MSTAAAPAGSFSPSFQLLVCGTLVAAVLGAAHRLGLFYRLMHKVRGHRGEASWGQPKEDLARDCQQSLSRALPHTRPGLCRVRGNGEVTAARALNTPSTRFPRGLEPFSLNTVGPLLLLGRQAQEKVAGTVALC